MLRRCAAALFVLLAGLVLPVHGQVAFAWKLNKGDAFYVRTVTTYKQTLKAPGREAQQNVEQTVVLGFTVEDKSADGYVLKQRIEGVSIKSGTAPVVADDRLSGVELTITLSPKMEVLKIEGRDKILDKLSGEDVNVRRILQAVLNDEALRKSVRELFAFLPDRPVKEGESWERSLDAPFGPLGTLKLSNTYKYEGKEDLGGKKVEKITCTTAVEYKPGKADMGLPYYVVSGDIKSDDPRGTIHFDLATGRLVQSESKMGLRGRLILSISGTNVDAEILQEQTTKVAVLNDNPVKK